MSEKSAIELAGELAALDGVEHEFKNMVAQIVDGHRQASAMRIMRSPGATADTVARDMATLSSALEKIADNLRAQFGDFLAAHVALRADKLSLDELTTFVELLRDPKIQAYFARMRALQAESSVTLRRLAEKMVRTAVGLENGSAARPPL